MKRLIEFIKSLLRREAKPHAVAVLEAQLEEAKGTLQLLTQRVQIEVAKNGGLTARLQDLNDWELVKKTTPSGCPWDQQDQKNLKAFLSSASGRRFLTRCRGLQHANAIGGSEGQIDYSHAAGLTAGCGEMVNYIWRELAERFDAPEEQPAEDHQPENESAEDFVARMTP